MDGVAGERRPRRREAEMACAAVARASECAHLPLRDATLTHAATHDVPHLHGHGVGIRVGARGMRCQEMQQLARVRMLWIDAAHELEEASLRGPVGHDDVIVRRVRSTVGPNLDPRDDANA